MNPNDPQYGANPSPQQQQSYGPYNTQPRTAPVTTADQNPYDFILNPENPTHSSVAAPNKSRALLIALAGGVFLLILVFVVASQLFANKNTTSPLLLGIAQRQQEVIRLATLGKQNVSNESLKGFALTTELSVGTNQTQLLGYLSTHGGQPKPELLGLKKDSASDTLLEKAQATSTYDSAFQTVLANELRAYATDLQSAYKQTSSAKAKQLLKDSYTSAAMLVAEAEKSPATP